jgi:hypothetical protein
VDPIPAVEREIGFDLARRGAIVAPIAIAIGALIAGVDGAISVAIALAIVTVNFMVAALSVGWAANISPQAVGAAAAGSYVLRLAAIFVVLFFLKDASFINLAVLGFALVLTHLALLFWETKHLSMSLAAPGLRPQRPVISGEE